MIDLHTHTTASDGSLSPTELAALAQRSGISYLALTDHNTTAGLPEFLVAAKGTTIKPIAGAEISCQLNKKELHILALHLPERHFDQLEGIMQDPVRQAELRRRELVDNLRRAGYEIYYEDIEKAHPGSLINRSHIGLALLEKGYVPSVEYAFYNLLSEDAGFYHPSPKLQALDVVGIIHDLGAISVWAHPFLRLPSDFVVPALEALSRAGLVGMEVYYSTYNDTETQTALALAQRFHLKPSGGSDFHGEPKPDIQIGIGKGNLCIPDSVAENLLGPV